MISPGKEYNYIDLAYILDVADGDKDFIEQMISTYLVSIPENINKLAIAASNGENEQVSFYAHTLKGAFNFIGNTQLSGMCDLLEQSYLESGDNTRIADIVSSISELAAHATAELATVPDNIV
jgi:HPt (histidine-containing phosphotransfer) domain-containing protein